MCYSVEEFKKLIVQCNEQAVLLFMGYWRIYLVAELILSGVYVADCTRSCSASQAGIR